MQALRLSWPSKSFVEDDTSTSAVAARQEMFPGDSIFATVPSIGENVIFLERLEKLTQESQTAVVNYAQTPTPTNRCEQVLSKMLLSHSLRDTSTGSINLNLYVIFVPLTKWRRLSWPTN